MYELIITEKPSTAAKIAAALADGKPVKKAKNKVPYYELSHNKKDIVVASAVGHLFTVAEKEKSYKYPSYDIEWQLTADVEKGAAFSRKYATLLKQLAKNATTFTVATDYDIEGETIGVNIIKYLCKQQDANRMKFSTVTADDLKEAYAEKTPTIDWGQANAGVTRHVLDWLYGINISRALSGSVKKAGGFMVLSAGRVQGPALKIVVEREKEIVAFVPEDYWQLTITGTKEDQAWSALHEEDRFFDKKKADTVKKKCDGKPATVESVTSKEYKQQAPVPFDLGGLQAEAYRAFGIKPKETLDIAQNLYANAYISYPRTSSQKLPAKIGFRKILKALSLMEQYKTIASHLMDKKLLTPNEGKKDDAAHPAIFPTGVEPEEMTAREEKIYDLIVKRFFATFGPPATRETNTIAIVIAGERFLCKGTRTTDPGWHDLYKPYVDLKEEELPPFKEKETVVYDALEEEQKQTKPPNRYTPSSLITELEKRGLGTKATRADIIESLSRRNYIKGSRNIEVTELGMKIFDILEKSSPEIVDEELTRHFEEELDQIRSDEKTSEEIIEEAQGEINKILAHFKEREEETGIELMEARKIEQEVESTLFPCPTCKDGTLKIMYSKKTKRQFIGCSNYPDCETTASVPQGGKIVLSDKTCEHCGWQMVAIIRKARSPQPTCINQNCPAKKELEREQAKRAKAAGEGTTCGTCGKGKMAMKSGRFGMFLACDQYPKCKTIVNIPKSDEEAKQEATVKERAKEAGEGTKCQNCEDGKLALRKSARGYFLGCDQYPKCKTVVKIPEA